MLFSVVFSLIIIFLTLLIDELIAELTFAMEDAYGENFIFNTVIFTESSKANLEGFCPNVDKMLLLG